uniref:CTCHY-type domain-containing protein n=1 Tax=Glossina morsitans morsitans TaxID=37546 RepID=A0A1B0FHU2_GLOMM
MTLYTQQTTEQSGKLLIKCEDETRHPRCPHGPTLLFYMKDKGPEEGFYACAAYRDRKLCSYNVPVKDLNSKQHLNRVYYNLSREYRAIREKFWDETYEKEKHYCLTCNVPLKESDLQPHSEHSLLRSLSENNLKDPTSFLLPINNDKGNAQYYFDLKALQFFEGCLRKLEISKILCMGAPRLHGYLRNHCKNWLQSFLLDLDHRFHYFYDDEEFAWYNMCNNFFFDECQRRKFIRFLKIKSSQRLLLFTDPPFGCRTEPIINTLRELSKLFNEINHLPHQPLPIFWVFPYFSEQYIQAECSAFEMCDYKVNYINHLSYTDNGHKFRKLGSPVRLFTNVPLGLLKLPVGEGYKYCARCERYTALENRHCNKCNKCPSKNGATYRHCLHCGTCVKPYYIHCGDCHRCTQKEGHNCVEYQAKQRCRICGKQGHTEPKCSLRKT